MCICVGAAVHVAICVRVCARLYIMRMVTRASVLAITYVKHSTLVLISCDMCFVHDRAQRSPSFFAAHNVRDAEGKLYMHASLDMMHTALNMHTHLCNDLVLGLEDVVIVLIVRFQENQARA